MIEHNGHGPYRVIEHNGHGPYRVIERKDPDLTISKVYYPQEGSIQGEVCECVCVCVMLVCVCESLP